MPRTRLVNWYAGLFLAFICVSFPLLARLNKNELEVVELRKELGNIESKLTQFRRSLSAERVEKNSPTLKSSTSTNDEFIRLRQELESVQHGLDELPIQSKTVVSSSEKARRVSSKPIKPESLREWDGFERKGLGFYILPFLGTYQADGLEWKSIMEDIEIGEEHGFSSGVRLGHGWKYFFTDFQLSYFQNELESLDIGISSISFSGKTDGMGAHLSAGVKVPVSNSFNLTLGGGVGGTQQHVSFFLTSGALEEEDFLFSYQFFTGLEYHPIDHLRLGIRYRWLRVGNMAHFTARDLHLAELSLGYVF